MYSCQRASSLSVRVLTLLTGELTLLDGSPHVRGILGGVCLADSVAGVRLAASRASAGGARRMQAEVSGDAIGRRAGTESESGLARG